MNQINRRELLGAAIAGAGLGSIALADGAEGKPARAAAKDDISIAQWALVSEVREGMWKTVDFPKIAREVFDINGIEFVNTLFEVPTTTNGFTTPS